MLAQSARTSSVPRPLRPGVSETFPYPTRYSKGELPLAYFDAGNANGPALIFVHGLGGNFTHWEHVAPAFAKTHRVIGLDMPGCGDSAKPDIRYSIDLFAASVVRLMDELGIDKAALVGHSLGGAVVSQTTLKYPERVRRMVLINSAGFMKYPVTHRLAARALFRRKLITPAIERFAIKLLEITFHEKNDLVRHFISQAEGRDPHPTVDDFGRLVETLGTDLVDLHFVDVVERLTVPTMVLWGDKDRLLPIRALRRWVPRLPNGRLVVLRNCGHMPIIERPQAVIDALTSFLGATQPRELADSIPRANQPETPSVRSITG